MTTRTESAAPAHVDPETADTVPPPPTADLARVMRCIPHRFPFLLIDRVEAIRAGESAVGIKLVTINEPHFQGHFPAEPIMPGVLIVEAMAQTAGVLVVETLGRVDDDLLVYFMTIDKTRFRRKVVPGDVLELHVSIQRSRGPVWKFAGIARVGDDVAAESEFSAMIIDENDSRRGGGSAGGRGGEPGAERGSDRAAQSGPESGTASGSGSGTGSGTVSGTGQGTVSGTASGTGQSTVSGTGQSTVSGTGSCTGSGTGQGTEQGAAP